MIVNNPLREPVEGIQHFSLKKKIAMLADSYYNRSGRWNVKTWYEYQFDVNDTAVGERAYRGDVVCFFHDKLDPLEIDFAINFECDGYEGHSSRTERLKNRVRDESMKFSALRIAPGGRMRDVRCFVKRILVGVMYTDEELADEFEDVLSSALRIINNEMKIV